MADYSFEEQKKITKEMSDKIYNDSYTTTEEELVKDVNWIQASKDVYKQLEGVEWSGSDEDAAKKGLDMMGRFNYNLTLGTINYTAQLQDAPDQTKLSFYYLMDMYDKKDISGNGVLRAFKEMGLDPASYIGIGTLGMGFVGKQAAATTAKTGLKQMLKQGAIRFLQSPTAVASTEAAIYTSADDIARQDAAIGAGFQDEYSPGQTAVAGAVGATVGAGFVQGTKAIGKGINKVITAGEEEMAKMAGGGTPPPIVQEVSQSIDKTTRDANFQKWFSGSQVVDDAGDPLVMYHGTNADFDIFKDTKTGLYYTTNNVDTAEEFALGRSNFEDETGVNIMPLYVNAKKLFDFNNPDHIASIRGMHKENENDIQRGAWYVIEHPDVLNAIKKKGYDGVMVLEDDDVNVGIFDPKGIKSIHNKGTFSKEDANILKSLTIGAGATGVATQQEENRQ